MLWLIPTLSCTIVSTSLHSSAYCFKQFLVSLKSPENHSWLCAVIHLSHWSAQNSPMSLRVLTTKTPDNQDQEIVQASWLFLSVLTSFHQKTDSDAVWQCAENEFVPHHVWAMCAVAVEEAHLRSILAKHSTKTHGIPHLFASRWNSWSCHLSFWDEHLSKRTAVLSQYPVE